MKASYPGFIEPALATSIDKVPTGDRWIHENKFDASGRYHEAIHHIQVLRRNDLPLPQNHTPH
jgi:bifunctional non-homologous end joining protein LigD